MGFFFQASLRSTHRPFLIVLRSSYLFPSVFQPPPSNVFLLFLATVEHQSAFSPFSVFAIPKGIEFIFWPVKGQHHPLNADICFSFFDCVQDRNERRKRTQLITKTKKTLAAIQTFKTATVVSPVRRPAKRRIRLLFLLFVPSSSLLMGHIQPGIEVAGPQHFVYIFSFALTNRI